MTEWDKSGDELLQWRVIRIEGICKSYDVWPLPIGSRYSNTISDTSREYMAPRQDSSEKM